MALLDFVWDYPGEWYQKGKTNLDLLEQEIASGSGICWAICNANSLWPPRRSTPVGDTWVHLIPIVHTHRVPPCMVQSRLGAFLRYRREFYLIPASQASIFNPLNHRELHSHCCHQCLNRPDCTLSQVRCIQPDRMVSQSIATLLLSQGEPTVWSSMVFAKPTELWPFSPALPVHWQSLLPLKDAS